MATQAEIEAALQPHAERLADGAAPQLAALWSGQLTTADPNLLPDFIAGRLANPVYSGFLKPTQVQPVQETQAQQPPAESPTQRHFREFKERLALSGSMVGPAMLSPQEAQRIREEFAAREAAKPKPTLPWVKEGMTPAEETAARMKWARENSGAIGIKLI